MGMFQRKSALNWEGCYMKIHKYTNSIFEREATKIAEFDDYEVFLEEWEKDKGGKYYANLFANAEKMKDIIRLLVDNFDFYGGSSMGSRSWAWREADKFLRELNED